MANPQKGDPFYPGGDPYATPFAQGDNFFNAPTAVPVATPIYGQPGYGGAAQPQYNNSTGYGAYAPPDGNTAPQQYSYPTGYNMPSNMVQVPLGQGGYGGEISVGEPLPTPADQPIMEAGYKDVWAGILFWLHVLVIVIIAFALGIPAMKADGQGGDNDPARADLDFNSALFVRMILLSLFVAGAVSVGFFFILRKYGGQIITCALYTSAALELVMACVTFAFAPVAGVFLLLLAAITVCYIYFVRNRIPFAAAHLETACDVIRTYPSLFFVALTVLALQAVWVFFWSAAALGIQHKLNQDERNEATTKPGDNDDRESGGIFMFFMLIFFFWGILVFRGVIHFVTASVVGNWWFLGSPHAAVWGSLHRAMTANFGSIALGALITSVVRAIEATARGAERRARGSNRAGAAFAAACAVCIISLVRRIVEYFNEWALIYVALTGVNYTRGGREAIHLFTKRGWSAVINDDLTGAAMRIVSMVIAALSAVIAGGTAYVFMGHQHSNVAGFVAFFAFVAGLAMAFIMTGVATSAVRAVFVCFALNPAALGATHPAHLQKLSDAWHKAHPQEFSSCGYTAAYYPGAHA